VTPDYFRTLGIPIVRGRAFTPQDTSDSRPVLIINETMAARVFGHADPIGRRLRSWRDENLLREIVGVVADVRYEGLGDEDRSLVYVPHHQNSWPSMAVALRAHGSPAALADILRREVSRLDRHVAVARISTLSAFAANSIAPQRFGALLLAMFAAAAALLAGIGVYGVMNYSVAQRRHELGVRLALGAQPRDLFAVVLGRGLLLTAFGGALGLAGALALGPVIRGLLFGVRPTDPATSSSCRLGSLPSRCSPARCPAAARRGSIRSSRSVCKERVAGQPACRTTRKHMLPSTVAVRRSPTLTVDPKSYWIFTNTPIDNARVAETFRLYGFEAGLDRLAASA